FFGGGCLWLEAHWGPFVSRGFGGNPCCSQSISDAPDCKPPCPRFPQEELPMVETSKTDDAFSRLETPAQPPRLAEVTRHTRHGSVCLGVKDKVLVTLKDGETMVLNCPIEQKALLMEISPEIYFETDHYVGWPAVLVRLPAIGDEELSLRLEDAWRFKAPK